MCPALVSLGIFASGRVLTVLKVALAMPWKGSGIGSEENVGRKVAGQGRPPKTNRVVVHEVYRHGEHDLEASLPWGGL